MSLEMAGKIKVRRIGLGSAVRTGLILSGIAGFFAGLFWGILFAFFSSFLASTVSSHDPGFGAGAIVVLPIFFSVIFGISGCVISFLFALIFNISAGISGGIELEIDTAKAVESSVPADIVSAPEAPIRKAHRVWKQPPVGLAARRGTGMRW